MKHKQTSLFISLLLVVFIDGLGQGIFFPILTKALLDPATAILMTHADMSLRHIAYALIVASFYIFWFFGAAILGDLSDVAGRKKALIICLVGAALGYFISAMGFLSLSLSLIILGRCIAGFTAGSQPIAQAAIIDIGDSKKVATNMALILLAVSAGLIGGPVIGGVLSNTALVSWFNVTTPLYFATLIAVLNVILLLIYFSETIKPKGKLSITFSRAVSIFISALTDKKIRSLALIFLLMQSAWANVYTFLPVLLAHHYAFSSNEITLIYALLGLGLAVGFAFITRWLEGKVKRDSVVAMGYGLMVLLVSATLLTPELIYISLLLLIAACGAACGYSFLLSMLSELAGSDRQGWIMGITGALNAVAFGVVPMLTGFIMATFVIAPLVIALFAVAVGGLWILQLKANI